MKLKKLMGALFIGMLGCSSALFSNEVPTVKPNCCKGPVLCSSFPVYGKDINCCDRVYHFDVGILVQQPWFSDMNAGVVYKKTNKQVVNQANAGATWGTSGQTGTSKAMTDTTSYNLEPCFDYDLGLTLSFGHLLAHDNWYVGLEFDYLASTKSKTYDAGSSYYYPPSAFDPIVAAYQMGFLPGWGRINPDSVEFKPAGGSLITPTSGANLYLYGGAFNKIDYKANINFYNLDLILSRGSYHSTCYSYEPFCGVKLMWYNGYQLSTLFTPFAGNQSVAGGTYSTSFDGYTALQTATDFISVNSSFNAFGAGPMFGFNGNYYITNEISIFSDSDIAVLYGNMSTKIVSYFTNKADMTTTSTDNGVRDTKYSNSSQEYFIPIRSVLGLEFSTYCRDGKDFVAVKIGYDARYIFSSNVKKHYAMSGLLVNFIWDF